MSSFVRGMYVIHCVYTRIYMYFIFLFGHLYCSTSAEIYYKIKIIIIKKNKAYTHQRHCGYTHNNNRLKRVFFFYFIHFCFLLAWMLMFKTVFGVQLRTFSYEYIYFKKILCYISKSFKNEHGRIHSYKHRVEQ